MEWTKPCVSKEEFDVKRLVASLVVVFSFAMIAARAADASKVSGYISDSMCNAKHAGQNSDCVKKCIEGGMTLAGAHLIVELDLSWHEHCGTAR